MAAYDSMAGYIYELNSDVFADVIPDTYQQFLEVLERAEVSTGDLAQAIDCDDTSMLGLDEQEEDEMQDDIFFAYDEVRRIFEAKTGLKLALTFIDPGSEYNEVEGPAWCVLNAMEYTPPAKVFERFITQKMFCIYG